MEFKMQEEIFDEFEKLFSPLNEYFLEKYKFTIEDFIQNIKLIMDEYNKRINLIEKALQKNNREKISPEELLNYLTNNCYLILNFNSNTFSKDIKTIIEINHFLEKFCHLLDSQKADFKTKPIFKSGNTYIVIGFNTLVSGAKFIFEQEIPKNSEIGIKYRAHKGDYLEKETKNVFEQILKNGEIFSSVKYSNNNEKGEADLLIIFDHSIILVEIKNRILKEVSKAGNDYFIQQDMEANIYEAYRQATRTEKYIQNNSEVKFRIGETKKTLTISNTEKFKIYKLGITLENLRTYAILYNKYETELENDMVFFNINDLKEIAKYIEYQTEFIHYLEKRIKCNKYLEHYYFYNELYLFSDYKIFQLENILNAQEKVKFWDIGREKLFDSRFRREEKLKILQREDLFFMKLLMKRLEQDKIKDYTSVMKSLLEIDLKGQKQIEEGIKEARKKYQQEKKEAMFFFTVEEEKELNGIIILVIVSETKNANVEKMASIYGATVKRKYPTYEVIICTNYINEPEYIINNCIYMKNVKEEADEYIEKIPELKNLKLF